MNFFTSHACMQHAFDPNSAVGQVVSVQGITFCGSYQSPCLTPLHRTRTCDGMTPLLRLYCLWRLGRVEKKVLVNMWRCRCATEMDGKALPGLFCTKCCCFVPSLSAAKQSETYVFRQSSHQTNVTSIGAAEASAALKHSMAFADIQELRGHLSSVIILAIAKDRDENELSWDKGVGLLSSNVYEGYAWSGLAMHSRTLGAAIAHECSARLLALHGSCLLADAIM